MITPEVPNRARQIDIYLLRGLSTAALMSREERGELLQALPSQLSAEEIQTIGTRAYNMGDIDKYDLTVAGGGSSSGWHKERQVITQLGYLSLEDEDTTTAVNAINYLRQRGGFLGKASALIISRKVKKIDAEAFERSSLKPS